MSKTLFMNLPSGETQDSTGGQERGADVEPS